MTEYEPTTLTNADFIRVMMVLPGDAPIARKFAASVDPRYETDFFEKAHMLGWFRSQGTLGSGAYSRATPNFSARTTYNRLQSAPGLMWIGEAIGADKDAVQAAADEAAAERHHLRRCSATRRHLPWDTMIGPLAVERLNGFRWG